MEVLHLRVREWLALAFGLVAGLTIAYVDSSPHWDDTGVTVAALVLAAAVCSALAGRRPWLWALVVGLWTPLVEVPLAGQLPAIAALGMAGIGSAIGYGLARSVARPTASTDVPPHAR